VREPSEMRFAVSRTALLGYRRRPDPGGELSSNLSGMVSAGYSADYGNDIDSSHG